MPLKVEEYLRPDVIRHYTVCLERARLVTEETLRPSVRPCRPVESSYLPERFLSDAMTSPPVRAGLRNCKWASAGQSP